MENEKQNNLTMFDELIQDRQLQMLKAAVPYISGNQKSMAFMIKFMELQRTISLFDTNSTMQMCSVPESEEPRPLQMLCAMKDFCTETEQENINMLINFVQMFSTYETLLKGE
jgi:hypothetical protein